MNSRRTLIIVTIVLLILGVGVAAAGERPPGRRPDLRLDGRGRSRLRAHGAALGRHRPPPRRHDRRAPCRRPTSESVFTNAGYAVHDAVVPASTSAPRRAPRSNVIAVKPGTSSKRIVIGAHYDSVQVGRGAFDNASGVALMLQLAEDLQSQTTPYTLVFAAWGSEEYGYFGIQGLRQQPLTGRDRRHDPRMSTSTASPPATSSASTAPAAPKPGRASSCSATPARSTWSSSPTPASTPTTPTGRPATGAITTTSRRRASRTSTSRPPTGSSGPRTATINTTKDGEIWHTRKDTVSFIEARYPGRMLVAALGQRRRRSRSS